MAKYRRHFLILLFLIGQIVSTVVSMNGNKKLQVIKQLYLRKQIKVNLFDMRYFDVSNAISEVLSTNWTQNHECLTELRAIRDGLQKHEEWAIRGTIEFSTIHCFLSLSKI